MHVNEMCTDGCVSRENARNVANDVKIGLEVFKKIPESGEVILYV